MFTLEQKNFIVHFNKSFRTFKALIILFFHT
jgi:hypothetical protein